MLSPRVPSFVDVEVATGGQDQLRERRIAWWLGIPMRDGECAESIAVKPPRGRDLRKLESLRPHHPASCRGPPGSHARPWRGFPALLLHGLRAEHVSLLWVWLRAAGLHATIPGPETLRNDAAPE